MKLSELNNGDIFIYGDSKFIKMVDLPVLIGKEFTYIFNAVSIVGGCPTIMPNGVDVELFKEQNE